MEKLSILMVLTYASILLLLCCSTLTTTSYSYSGETLSEQEVQDAQQVVDNKTRIQNSVVGELVGQVAKTVVYGGATFARLNNRLLCSLLTHETERDNEDQPTLFIFTNHLKREKAFRIYAQDEITSEMIHEAHLDPSQMTYIFVHGWLGGIHNELWLSEAKNAALQTGNNSSSNFLTDQWKLKNRGSQELNEKSESQQNETSESSSSFKANVIIVEWSDFAHGSLYTATQNSLKVSRRLARLLEQLVSVGKLKAQLMHCLGHSIGTHICGQAARLAFPPQPRPAGFKQPSSFVFGAQLSQRMGRITGLDPGGFCYELGIKNETTYLGLRPSDALLVDAYYSNRSPFGNKYLVTEYNVRINNGFFQRPCSVWLNPEFANEYFRAAVRFFLGTIGNNEILTCDHYFATRFATQLFTKTIQPTTCSYVAYACDSYRNFLRGQCGICNSTAQCYTMDFEYQRQNPSIEHALKQIELTHQSSDNNSVLSLLNRQQEQQQLIGAVPYDKRRIYYMRITNEEPYCSTLFRLRVRLNPKASLRQYRSELLKIQVIGGREEVLTVKESSSGKVTDSVSLFGPWLAPGDNESRVTEFQKLYGLDNRTLTGLFEIVDPSTDDDIKITNLLVLYDREQDRRRQQVLNPIESIQLDFLSSVEFSLRSRYSRSFLGENLKFIYKQD